MDAMGFYVSLFFHYFCLFFYIVKFPTVSGKKRKLSFDF